MLRSTLIIVLVSYGILCHCGNFSSDTIYEQVYKDCHPNLFFVHPTADFFKNV